MIRLYSYITALKKREKSHCEVIKTHLDAFGSAFVRFTSNATAVKRELRMFPAQKRDKD